mmetsp:Transcript_25494/g.52806  ORF Transcript_25494/g.52806 Transcript_25494/m.52806 type:complete len:275 (+) Transcript_25494:989-1813(+)
MMISNMSSVRFSFVRPQFPVGAEVMGESVSVFAVGDSVDGGFGDFDGEFVGSGSGEFVGDSVGSDVDDSDGNMVGEAVGGNIGIFDGGLVGDFESCLLGDFDGASVNEIVGLFVGEFDIVVVGIRDGFFVGTAVGVVVNKSLIGGFVGMVVSEGRVSRSVGMLVKGGKIGIFATADGCSVGMAVERFIDSSEGMSVGDKEASLFSVGVSVDIESCKYLRGMIDSPTKSSIIPYLISFFVICFSVEALERNVPPREEIFFLLTRSRLLAFANLTS